MTPASHTVEPTPQRVIPPEPSRLGAQVRGTLYGWEGISPSSTSSPVRSRLRSHCWPAPRCSGSITRNYLRSPHSLAHSSFRGGFTCGKVSRPGTSGCVFGRRRAGPAGSRLSAGFGRKTTRVRGPESGTESPRRERSVRREDTTVEFHMIEAGLRCHADGQGGARTEGCV
jgi:hypothetical protein